MPQIINTNIASLTAQRNLDRSQSANQQALSRLSSGLRINSSKDDAAGLAISTRFTSQIRGLNVAIRNVGDGVSLAQTADGALGTMTDNLQRIRELAIQSANATNSDVDREALQAEVDQLVAEISRTGEQTTFNGINLLDGEFNATFQIGANVGETVSFGISQLTADSLGGGKSAGVSAVGSSSALNNGDLVINGVVIGASTAADDSASTTDAAASAIAKAAAINKVSDDTGVTAQVLTNVATGSAMQEATGGANATSGAIVLNGVEISIATGDVDSTADRAAVITAINARSAETGVVAVDSGSAQGGVNLEAADGRNISLSFKSDGSNNLTAESTGLTSSAVTTGGYTLTSVDGSSPVVVTAGTGSLANAGLVEGSFSANTAAVNSTSRSSRAEVSSDVGDTGPLAATITGGEAVDLSNANFSAGDTTFDLVISGATSTYENQTATVTLNGDFRNQSLQDLVDEINSDLTGNIAAEAFILDGDKLGFRRTTEEAGDLQLGNFTTGSVPGGTTTIIASLGLQSTDTIGSSTVLDSDTNAVRGGQAGRAALTATPAVAASIASDGDILDGGTGLATWDFSGAGNHAQFDLIVSDAATASDNGTYTITVDTDFTNALYSGFASDAADRQRVLDELNEDLANAGAGDVLEAKFDPSVTRLVFERKNAETGGSIEIDNYVVSGTTDATDITNAFGFTAGRVSTDGTANSTVGADAKAPGASDAIGGTAIGIDTDSSLINGGIANATTDAFTAFAAATAATVTAGAATDTDFSDAAAIYTGTGATAAADFSGAGDALSFTLTDANGNSDNIVYNADATSVAALATALDALVVNATDITITESGGELVFTSTSTGRAAEVTISNLVEGGTASGLADGTTYGDGESSFTVYDGSVSVNVSLTTDYTDADGVRDEINAQLLAGGSSIVAVNNAGTLDLVSTDTGSDASVTITAMNEGNTATGFVNGLTSGTDGDYNFTYRLDGVEQTVDLRGAGTVTGAGGGTVIANYLDSLSGLTASYNASTNQFTIGATNGTTDLQLVDGADSALEYLGLSAGTFAHTPAVTGTETQAAVELSALNEGDLKINGVTIGSSSAASDTASSSLAESSDKAASGIAIAAAINAASSETGVSATVNSTVVNGGSSANATTDRNADGDQGVVYINGFATGTLVLSSDAETNRTDAISAINQISGQTGVLASDAGGYIRLTAADGRNISVAIDNMGSTFTGSNIGLSASSAGIAEADFTGEGVSYASVAETTASTVTLSSAKEFTIAAGTNGTDGLAGLGLVAGTYGGAEDGQFLTDIDISTVEGAEAAILALDNAIATVSSQRAGLGAIQNRLESTVGNLTVTAENLTAANSRITDADFAVETANLSKSQVLQQAGISILAQANASSQQVLSLLQ
jgi:flagellin